MSNNIKKEDLEEIIRLETGFEDAPPHEQKFIKEKIKRIEEKYNEDNTKKEFKRKAPKL